MFGVTLTIWWNTPGLMINTSPGYWRTQSLGYIMCSKECWCYVNILMVQYHVAYFWVHFGPNECTFFLLQAHNFETMVNSLKSFIRMNTSCPSIGCFKQTIVVEVEQVWWSRWPEWQLWRGLLKYLLINKTFNSLLFWKYYINNLNLSYKCTSSERKHYGGPRHFQLWLFQWFKQIRHWKGGFYPPDRSIPCVS